MVTSSILPNIILEGVPPLNYHNRVVVLATLLLALVTTVGCKKKTPPPPPQAAPPVAAPAPTAQINANPSAINDHLIAKGEGGTADATARVTVSAPPPVAQPTNTLSAEEEFRQNMQDIFFDYDAYDVRSDAQGVLSKDASYLASHPNIKVLIGGYCDERGSNEYNLALGQNRADAAKNALVTAGVAAGRIRVVSYGKEKPFCSESTEACWQQNRRAGFSLDQ